ncbi:MAG TPA: hypothetical protein PKV27_10410, partial [Ilumatobacteraceae bacterium]|nr:hypothetical protein [Ilumatobacteraceae bacterium]
SLRITFNLPPGWRLFALFGADWVRGDWLTAWTLLDLFLLLILSLTVFRLWGVSAALLAFIELIPEHLLGDRIALPVNITEQATRIANSHGISVTPTKISTSALMAAAMEPGMGFATDGDGGYILPGFLPAFDGAAALLKMLDLIARTGRSLSEVVDALPRVHLVHETVVTPWDQKGKVMRSLMTITGRDDDLVDGVRVAHNDGWVLALPDPEEPLTHLWAESATESDARRLVQEYARRVRQLTR